MIQEEKRKDKVEIALYILIFILVISIGCMYFYNNYQIKEIARIEKESIAKQKQK